MSWPDSFAASERLAAFVALALIAALYVVVALRRRGYTVRFTNLALLDTVAPRRPGWRRHVAAVVFLSALASLLLAWAKPAEEESVARERATVVLAIDTSLSMQATDVSPSRLDAAKTAALEFVAELPDQINIGLVTFDGVARVRVTPTTDRGSVNRAIDGLELGPATAIGEAILAGLDAIEAGPPVDAEGEPIPATLVVMTDGKTTVGRPDETGSAAAAAAGIPVSTIAFGTDRGTIMIEGELQPVPVEIASLQAIADVTDGRFFRAESLGELNSVYEDIGSSIGYTTETVEVTDRFVGYAAVLMLVSAGLSLLWFQRIP